MNQLNSNNNLMDAGNMIEYLRSAITDGVAGLFDAPALLRQIIEGGIWREHFVEQTQETARFDSFNDFISAPPPEGLGISRKTLYNFCSNDIIVLDLLDRTLQSPRRGGDRRSRRFKRDNV